MAILSALRFLPRSVAAAGLVLTLAGCVIAGQDRGRAAGSASSAADASVRGQRLVEMCESHYRAGQAALAAAACRRAMEMNPTRPQLLGRIGKLMVALDEPREAAVAYRRQLAVDPANAAAWFGLGQAEAAGGQYTAALTAFEKALAYDSNKPRHHNALAVTKDMLGDHAGAQTLYRQGLAIDPSDPLLRHNQGVSARLRSGGGAVSDLRYAFEQSLSPAGGMAAGQSGLASANGKRRVYRRSAARVARDRADDAPADLLRYSEIPDDEAMVAPAVDADPAEPSRFALQFGLFGSLSGAWEGRTVLRAVAGDLLGDIDLVIRRTIRPIRRRTAYLLRSEAIDTRPAAVALCNSLRTREVACRVIDLGEEKALSKLRQDVADRG